MINETATLTYDSIVQVTNHPIVLWSYIAIAFFTLFIYLLYGFFGKARTGQGQVVKGIRPIQKLNYWMAWFLLWFVGNVLLIFLLFIPIWVKLI